MHYAKSLLAISLASALCADTLPISSAFIDAMKTLKIEVKPASLPNVIEVVTPISETILMGGRRTYYSRSSDVKDILERQCLAYGGDIPFQIKDNFGDTVEAHSFDTAKLQSLSAEQRAAFTKLDPAKKNDFVVTNKEFRNLFTDQRLERGFIVDIDVLRPDNFYYDTTCKAIDSGKTLYTAKTKRNPDTMVVTFSEVVAENNFEKPKISKKIESLFTEHITEQKANKYLLEYKFKISDYYEKVRSFCEEASGKMVVDGANTDIYSSYVIFKQEIGCAEIEHPFVIRTPEPFKYMLITDTAPMYAKNIKVMEVDVSDIQMQGLALSTAMLPLGAQSENNIGNRKLVSTVYSDNGNSKLINVQEVGGNKSYKNYKVQSDWAKDITDDRFVYSNLKLPQSIQNAKNSLVQQCSQYGAGKVSIDGYTATCSRQAYGNQCSVNMIYMRNDQFAGREALGCK